MKAGSEVEHLIKDGMSQVFLMTCPATLPFSFAAHPWFVVNRKGACKWYAVGWREAHEGEEVLSGHVCHNCAGFLHIGSRSFEEGIAMFPFVLKTLWKGRLCGFIEGSDDSIAGRMSAFIADSPHEYPYSDRYSLLGPNSNTYAEWVIDRFPESGLRLPWNAIGKNYKRPKFSAS